MVALGSQSGRVPILDFSDVRYWPVRSPLFVESFIVVLYSIYLYNSHLMDCYVITSYGCQTSATGYDVH
jgi:hypothetical protein